MTYIAEHRPRRRVGALAAVAFAALLLGWSWHAAALPAALALIAFGIFRWIVRVGKRSTALALIVGGGLLVIRISEFQQRSPQPAATRSAATVAHKHPLDPAYTAFENAVQTDAAHRAAQAQASAQ